MHLTSALRHSMVCAALGFALASPHAHAATSARQAARPAEVRGLVVQLREAPSHVALARERALALEAGASVREASRWRRLVSELRSDGEVLRELPQWAGAAPRRDPVGHSAQVLRFAQPLTAEQAERVAARLAARADVAWVALNTREQPQAVAANPPSDPYFPGGAGQWWLQPVQGSNGNAIGDRRRGVAGFLSAWQGSSTGSASAVVAVLDSGITCHPDLGNSAPSCLGGAILPGYDFVSDSGYGNDGDGRDADPRDPGDWVDQADRSADPGRYANCELQASTWHGTIIAGIVAAQTDNAAGAAGINWNGSVLPVRVAGKCGADVVDIVEGMRWAAGLPACKRSDGAGACTEFAPPNQHPARIVNISFGGSAACGGLYQQAVDELRAAPGGGAVVVAAAGNGWSAPSRPANCQRVIGVAALNRDGFKTNYSNFGPGLAIASVGGDDGDGAWGSALGASSLADNGVLTIGNGAATQPSDCAQPTANCYYYHFGSSFSAPIVAGAVSLMLSVNPGLSAAQIEQGLALSARPHVRSDVPGFAACGDANPGRCLCTAATCGAGILDATQALLYAASPGTYVAPSAAGAVLDTPELRAAVATGPDRPANVPPATGGEGGGSGGGGSAALWVLALGLAVLALGRPVSVLRRSGRRARRPPQASCR